MGADRFGDALALSDMERLKWLVLRKFKVLPGSAEALALSDADFLFCGLNMVLDLNRGRAMAKGFSTETENPAFDIRRFEALGGRRA